MMLSIPNKIALSSIVKRIFENLQISIPKKNVDDAIKYLFEENDISELCKIVENTLYETVKRGDFKHQNELSAKILFYYVFKECAIYQDVEVEVIINEEQKGYVDLIIEKDDKRILFKFKNKTLPFLEILNNNNNQKSSWEDIELKANYISNLTVDELKQIKVTNFEKFDKGKSMATILQDCKKR